MATTAPQTFPRKNYAAAVGAVNVKSTPKAPAALKREASKTVANVLVPKQAKVDPEAWADAPASGESSPRARSGNAFAFSRMRAKTLVDGAGRRARLPLPPWILHVA